MTYFAPPNPGSSYAPAVRQRYCGHVSPNTWWPRARASAMAAAAPPAETCTT